MNKDYFIKLTLAVYRVTELFPDGEPLKFSIKEKANQILADSILLSAKNPKGLTKEQKGKVSEQILGNIEILQGYFKIGEAQKWIDERNFFVLEKEYDKMKDKLKKKNDPDTQIREDEESNTSLGFSSDGLGRERCKKILEILRQKGKAQTWEFKRIFPEITKRTLRRDLEYLLEKGSVERVGDKNNTFYRIKVGQ